jgi:transcriptional regulator with XRE-family HTH domain
MQSAEGREARRVTTFSAALTRAMDRQDVTIKALAARTGVNSQTISNLKRGINAPRLRTATILAEALHDEGLTLIVAADRRRECPVCGATFVTDHTDAQRRKFCSHKCQQVGWNRQANAGRDRKRARYEKKTTMRLREHQQAIEAFCRSCEPVDFICRDSECALRGVSPLPLITLQRRAA